MSKKREEGQQMIEYILLFVAVVLVLLIVYAPKGLMRNSIEKSIDISFNNIQDMAYNVYYNVYDEPWHTETVPTGSPSP